MLLTFNNGLGMVLIIKPADKQRVLTMLSESGQSAFVIGQMTSRQDNPVVWTGDAPW